MNELFLSADRWLFIGAVSCILALVVAALSLSANKRPRSRHAHADERRSTALPFRAYCKSVIGSRDYQQDYFRLPLTIPSDTLLERGLLCVVCDGMGGMDSGELASHMCADMLMDAYYDVNNSLAPEPFFRQNVALADSSISALRNKDGQSVRSGTTLISVILRQRSIYWASAGDSRIYLYRQNKLRQLTRDHNYRMQLMEQVEAGAITSEAAMTDPQREALISYVGKGCVDILDVSEMSAMPGDILLLCSDGLTKALSDDELLQVLSAHRERPYLLPGALIKEALKKGWMRHDNITAAIVSVAHHASI